MPNPERASYFPKGINMYVDSMQYHSEVSTQGICRAQIDSPVALNATGLLSAQSIAVALTTFATWAATYTAALQSGGLATYGRNVTVVASGAATSAVTVYGRDYLGQPVKETFTLNGTTPVAGKKAFKWVDAIDAGVTAATTINLGWGDVFGLPFCSDALLQENVDGVVPASAGTFVSAIKTNPGTATTGDPRGTYAPHTSNASNGSRTYRLELQCDKDKLHGVKHFGG